MEAPARGRSSATLERMDAARGLVFAPMTVAAVLPGAVITYFYRAYGGTANLAGFWLLVSLIAAAHVVLLGIPGALLLNRLRLLNGWSLLPVGFVGGCLPIGIYTWLVRNDPLLNHKDDARFVIFCGACGALGALAAAVTYTAMRSNNRWRGP
jgi:hypothetical protein